MRFLKWMGIFFSVVVGIGLVNSALDNSQPRPVAASSGDTDKGRVLEQGVEEPPEDLVDSRKGASGEASDLQLWQAAMRDALATCQEADERFETQIDDLHRLEPGELGGAAAQATIEACRVARRQMVRAPRGQMGMQDVAASSGTCIQAVMARENAAKAVLEFAIGNLNGRTEALRIVETLDQKMAKCLAAIEAGPSNPDRTF